MTDRRTFVKQSALLTAGMAAATAWDAGPGASRLQASTPGAEMPPPEDVKELMMEALNAARMAGASYADVRIQRQRQNFVFTREQQIQNLVDTDSLGAGVRALVDGTWGFSATRTLTRDAVAAASREAVAIAKAHRVARGEPVEWLRKPRSSRATRPRRSSIGR